MNRYKAPGKLLLMGEHAVMYGYPSIVTTLNTYISVSVETNTASAPIIRAQQVKNTSFIEESIAVAHKRWNTPLSITVTVDEAFPSTYGFGSSAAVTVATLTALLSLRYKDIHIKKHEIWLGAFEVVKNVQGKGSGFDVAASTYGGTLWYNQLGKDIKPLHIRQNNVVWIIGYTGVKADTVSLVEAVEKEKELYPEKINKLFEDIGNLVKQAEGAIRGSDWKTLGLLFTQNQTYLKELGVSSTKINTLISASLSGGAYGAKLSGAGGGDCIIALGPRDRKLEIENAIKNVGGIVLDVDIQAEGVKEY